MRLPVLNAIECMHQTICDATSSRLVLHEQKGWDRGGGLVHPNGENSMVVSGLGCENSSVEPFLLF